MIGLLKKHKKLVSFTTLKILGDGMVFLFPLLLAGFLNTSVYGSFSLSMMIIFFATTIFLASSQTPFIIEATKELKETKKIVSSFTTQVIFFVISLLSLGILFLLLETFIKDYLSLETLLFLYLAFVGIAIKSLVNNYFLAINKKIKSTQYMIYYGVIQIIVLFILPISLNNIFLNYFLSSIGILLLLILFKEIKYSLIFPLSFSKKIFLDQWEFTRWQILGLTAVYFINWGDTILINYFLELKDVGVYNFAYQIFKGIITFLFVINTFYLADITRNLSDKKYIQDYLGNTRKNLFLIGTLIILISIPLVSYLFNFIIGMFTMVDRDYLRSILILQVLLLGVIFKFWSIFYTPLFNSLKKFKFIQSMNIVQIIINISLGIVGVLLYGLIGIAIATSMSYLFRAIVDECYFHQKVKKLL